jgi:hypothetical protein
MRTLLWLLVAGCAPAYRPPAPFTPLLDQRGDAQIAAHLGTGGAQVDGAYAVSDAFQVRGSLQGAGCSSPGHYAVATVGAGVYGADMSGLRWAVSGQVGGGASRGITDLTVIRTTIGGQSTSEVTRFQNSGALLVGAARPELGYETESFAVATVLGASFRQLHHDQASDGMGLTFDVAAAP